MPQVLGHLSADDRATVRHCLALAPRRGESGGRALLDTGQLVSDAGFDTLCEAFDQLSPDEARAFLRGFGA